MTHEEPQLKGMSAMSRVRSSLGASGSEGVRAVCTEAGGKGVDDWNLVGEEATFI